MFHSRSGQTMSARAHNAQAARSDIELQEVGPFARGDLPPPQTRPFTGVLDQHHCLLSEPHSRQSFPTTGSRIPRQFAPDSTKSHKRHSSGVHNLDKGHVRATQNPQRRHSSSSQKLRSRGSSSPSQTGQMTRDRREQMNGITATASGENHVERSNDAKTDRAAENAQHLRKDMQRSPSSNNEPDGVGGAENAQVKTPADKYSALDDRSCQGTGVSGARSVISDTTDGVLRKTGNNYERLQSGPSTSQHLYRPISEHPEAKPAKVSITTPNPSTSSKPLQGAKSPLYDSVDVCTQQVRPESHPFLPSKRCQHSEHPDDIIELQSDIKMIGGPREEMQNKSNTQKEVPEVTDIPNTNFAIACMVALCFNLPFGVLAMYFSLRAVKAFQEGRAKLGERRSRWSIVLSLLGITITTVIISSVVLYTAMQGQKRISRHKAYGRRAGLNL